MKSISTSDSNEFSPEDAAARRDKVLEIMLHTPPKPHATLPQSLVRNRKKAGADQQGRAPEKSGPAS
jgi:hypothetical protein